MSSDPKKCCLNCEYFEGEHCHKFDYSLKDTNIEEYACEQFVDRKQIPKKKKKACMNCIYEEAANCRRYPPADGKHFPVVDGLLWCGEYIERGN